MTFLVDVRHQVTWSNSIEMKRESNMLRRKEEGCMELVSLSMKGGSTHVIYKDNTEKCNSNKQFFEVTLCSKNNQRYTLLSTS